MGVGGGGGGGSAEKPKQTEQDKENLKLVRGCQTSKTLYLKITAVQQSMLKSLKNPDSDTAWLLLANQQNVDAFTELMNVVLDGAKDEFSSSFINGDIGDLKKEFAGKMHDFSLGSAGLRNCFRLLCRQSTWNSSRFTACTGPRVQVLKSI